MQSSYSYSFKRLLKDIAILAMFFIVSYVTFWAIFHFEMLREVLNAISNNVSNLFSSPIFTIVMVFLGLTLLGSGVRIYVSSWRGGGPAILGIALIGAGVLMLVFFSISILQRFFTTVGKFIEYFTP